MRFELNDRLKVDMGYGCQGGGGEEKDAGALLLLQIVKDLNLERQRKDKLKSIN